MQPKVNEHENEKNIDPNRKNPAFTVWILWYFVNPWSSHGKETGHLFVYSLILSLQFFCFIFLGDK